MNPIRVNSDESNKSGASTPPSWRCLRCGGDQAEPGRLVSEAWIRFRPTNTKFWALAPDAEVRAYICVNCGHIELFGDIKKVERVTVKPPQ